MALDMYYICDMINIIPFLFVMSLLENASKMHVLTFYTSLLTYVPRPILTYFLLAKNILQANLDFIFVSC